MSIISVSTENFITIVQTVTYAVKNLIYLLCIHQ